MEFVFKSASDPAAMTALHAMLRRNIAANHDVTLAMQQYKESPTDDNACRCQMAWKEMRGAIDGLIRMDQVSIEGAWLAQSIQWKQEIQKSEKKAKAAGRVRKKK